MTSTASPPTLSSLAAAARLLRDGYPHWEGRRAEAAAETVRTRLAHERVTVVRGEDAARFFYEGAESERASAMPTALVGPLFGRGAVHTLDGPDHHHRKGLFTSIIDHAAAAQVADDLAARWDASVTSWRGHVDLFDEAAVMLFSAGCAWVGLPDPVVVRRPRARDMVAMVDGFGGPGLRQVRARIARRRADAWVTSSVEDVRARSRRRGADDAASPQTPLEHVALHRQRDGSLLPPKVAAVEVLNLVRPLVASAWLFSTMVEAIGTDATLRTDVVTGEVTTSEVAQESRRTSPFVPFLATRVVERTGFEGTPVDAGDLLVLDVWGTNHDPRTWHDPFRFDPRRFRTTAVTPFNLVSQGGGEVHHGHRCPGEDVVLLALTVLAPRLAGLPYTLVDASTSLRRMPPRPRRRVHVP